MPLEKSTLSLGRFYWCDAVHWSPDLNQFFTVDRVRRYVCRHDPSACRRYITHIDHPAASVGSPSFVIPVAGRADTYVVGIGNNVCSMDWDGQESSPNRLTHIVTLDQCQPNTTINHGKCDPMGRLWMATTSQDQTPPETSSLFSLDEDLNLKSHLSGARVSNGLAWNGSVMYFVESDGHEICSVDYDPTTGNVDNQRVVYDVRSQSDHIKGTLQGLDVASDGMLWVALFGGHKVLGVDPRTGKAMECVRFQVDNLHSVTFGGPNLDVLYASSSMHTLSLEQLGRQPLAGSVHTARGLETQGASAGVPFKGNLPERSGHNDRGTTNSASAESITYF